MGFLLGALGLGLGAAGSAANFISQAKEARKRAEALDKRALENEEWYTRKYYENYTQSAAANDALKKMRNAMQERMNRASGAAAVSGASSESVAAEKAAANKAIGDTVSAIAARDDARKERVDDEYRRERRAIENARDNISLQKQQNTAAATSQALNTAGNIIALGGEMGGSGGNKSGQRQSPTATTVTKAGSTSLFDPRYREEELSGWWNRDNLQNRQQWLAGNQKKKQSLLSHGR